MRLLWASPIVIAVIVVTAMRTVEAYEYVEYSPVTPTYADDPPDIITSTSKEITIATPTVSTGGYCARGGQLLTLDRILAKG
jgi:hypothetical protein